MVDHGGYELTVGFIMFHDTTDTIYIRTCRSEARIAELRRKRDKELQEDRHLLGAEQEQLQILVILVLVDQMPFSCFNDLQCLLSKTDCVNLPINNMIAAYQQEPACSMYTFYMYIHDHTYICA